MMMINVPWHFRVDAFTGGKEKKKKNTQLEPLFTSIIILKHPPENSSIYCLTCLRPDLTIILISQPRSELIC